MLIRHALPGFRNRVLASPAALLVPLFDAWVPRNRNVLAVLAGPSGRLLIPASNIVTDAGDLYYAQKGAGEATTNAFGVHELGSAGTPAKGANRSAFTPIGSTQKAHAATYPKTNDGDADNTGAGTDIVSYLASYAKADFTHAAVTHGWITNVTPGASEPLLTGYAFAAAFEKTADDTLKVFANHEMLGA
jgi:hypothetical protein